MELLRTLFFQIVDMSITASIVILIIILLRLCIRRAPKIFSFLLWSAVGFRLICPISFSSIISILNICFYHDNRQAYQGNTMSYLPEITRSAVNTGSNHTSAASNASYVGVPAVSDKVHNILAIGNLLTTIWVLGFMILLMLCLRSYLKLRKKVAFAVLLRDNIYECNDIPSPFVMGFRKPRIYIPFRLRESEQDYILMHEQYHVKRLDHLIKLFAFLLLTVHWFNPLIWIAYYLMCKDMEMSCDEKVLLNTGISVKREYSLSLLSFAANYRFSAVGPLAFGETATKERIKNILHFKKPKLWLMIIIGAISLLAIFACTANPKKLEANTTSVISEGKDSDLAKQLYDNRNPYIGNAPADGTLLKLLGIFDDFGAYTIELTTAKRPYALKIVFKNEGLNRDNVNQKMYYNATILLALIDNADRIEWSYPDLNSGEKIPDTVSFTAEDLSSIYQISDIKSYGTSESKVKELFRILDHPSAVTPPAPTGADIQSFLEKNVTMSDYLSYQLPKGFTDSDYNAQLSGYGGNLFLYHDKLPDQIATAPIEWYAAGGVVRLSKTYLSNPEDSFVQFQDGRLISGSMHANHTWELSKPAQLHGLSEQAIIMEIGHDLCTPAEAEEARLSGKPIPEEDQTSQMYEIYFAREDSDVSYCIFLNEEYFTYQDAVAFAKTIKFTHKAF